MHHDYQRNLIQIWHDAVDRYRGGQVTPEGFLSEKELSFIDSIGMNVMDVFDFAEDWVREGTPDLGLFLLIHDARRDYFLREQGGQPSSQQLD